MDDLLLDIVGVLVAVGLGFLLIGLPLLTAYTLRRNDPDNPNLPSPIANFLGLFMAVYRYKYGALYLAVGGLVYVVVRFVFDAQGESAFHVALLAAVATHGVYKILEAVKPKPAPGQAADLQPPLTQGHAASGPPPPPPRSPSS